MVKRIKKAFRSWIYERFCKDLVRVEQKHIPQNEIYNIKELNINLKASKEFAQGYTERINEEITLNLAEELMKSGTVRVVTENDPWGDSTVVNYHARVYVAIKN